MGSIKNFIESGTFLGIGLGSTLREVVDTVGVPFRSTDDPLHSLIYNYDIIEFIFGKSGVASIEICFERGDFSIDDFVQFERMVFNDFVDGLKELSIRYKIMTRGMEIIFVFDRKTTAIFSNGRMVIPGIVHKAVFLNDKLSSIGIIDSSKIY